MGNLNDVVYKNQHYDVIITKIYSDNIKQEVFAYGVRNLATGVVESFLMSLSDAMAKAEVESAIFVNSWWKSKAALEINLLSSAYDSTKH